MIQYNDLVKLDGRFGIGKETSNMIKYKYIRVLPTAVVPNNLFFNMNKCEHVRVSPSAVLPTAVPFNTNEYDYVPPKEWKPVKKEIIKILNETQKLTKEHFTFRYDFIGSAKHNMITWNKSSNIGYDFDVNITVNYDDNEYSEEEIKRIIIKALNKVVRKYGYDYCEDSTRVITIKVKDQKNSKILHSCDFAILNDYVDNYGNECQEYIRFNKKDNTYTWERQSSRNELEEEIEWIQKNVGWNKVRAMYLDLKNKNQDINKKSRSLFAETINNIYCKYN